MSLLQMQILVFIFVMYMVINPLYGAFIFTRPPRFRISFRTPKDWGAEYEQVALVTADGVTLDGWYISSRNGAAVILLHGHSGNRLAMTFYAERLIQAGYGVLLYDLRGHGSSGGRRFTRGQSAPEDVLAGVTYLSKRPDVNAGGIGVVGLSVGGLFSLQAAVRTVAVRAVVADGASPAVVKDLPVPTSWWGRLLQIRQLYYMRLSQLFEGTPRLPATVDIIGDIAPRPILLISAGQTGEQMMVRQYYEAAGEHSYLWEIPEAAHVAGSRVRPDEYAHKLVTFFNETLIRSVPDVLPSQSDVLAELFPSNYTSSKRPLPDDVAYDATISMGQANLVAFLLVPIAWFLVVGTYRFIWGEFVVEMGAIFGTAVWLRAILIFLASIVVHELLHAIGYVYVGKASWKQVKFGFSWKGLAPYAHCRVPMKLAQYRISVMLPGIVLGILPAVFGLVVGNFWLSFFGVLMLMAAGGDLAVLLAVRKVPPTATVRDHDSMAGCEVLKEETKGD